MRRLIPAKATAAAGPFEDRHHDQHVVPSHLAHLASLHTIMHQHGGFTGTDASTTVRVTIHRNGVFDASKGAATLGFAGGFGK